MEKMPSVIQKENTNGYIYTESAGEYTLPDYLPEVRKLLKIDTKVTPTGKYFSSGKVEFSGIVCHTVIYAGEDGALAATTLESPYELASPVDAGGDCEMRATFEAENVNCRLTGPRKLSIKTKLRASAHILTEEEIDTRVTGDVGNASIERRLDTVTVKRSHYASSDDIILCEYEKVDTASPESLKVLYCSGEVLVRECRRAGDHALCRGDVYLKCVCAEGDAVPYSVGKKIAFECPVYIAECRNEKLVATGRCDGVEVNVTVADGGCELEFNACVVVDCECHGDDEIVYVTDIYSCEREGKTEREQMTADATVGCAMGNFSIGGSSPKGDGDDADASRIIDSFGKIVIESVEEKHGRVSVSGSCQASMIYANVGDSANAYGLHEFAFPFRAELDCRVPEEEFECECHGSLVTCRGRMDASSFIFDGEVALALTLTKKVTFSPVTEADFSGEEIERGENAFKIYYPTKEETLWDVAKRYRMHANDISSMNSLEGVECSDCLSAIGKTHLIIC